MSKKILIVDDEPDVIIFLSAVLEESGYETIGAKDGVEGLELLRKESPDLVVLDVMLPRKSGMTMFQELRQDEKTSRIPVVIVTGVSEVMGVDFKDFTFRPADDKTAIQAPGPGKEPIPDAYIEKPIDPEELVKVIKDALKE